MLPLKWANRLAVLIPLVAVLIRAEPYDVGATLDDQNDSIMWENMLPEIRPKASRSLPDSTYLAALLNEPQGDEEPQLEFPKLTSKQRQFGVNPGYQSFNDPKIRYMAPYNEEFEEDNDLEPEISENSEVVKDPFSEEGSSKKRVVPLNLSKENLAIVEAALEQQKIDDIYFTTIVAVASALLASIIVGAGIFYHRYHTKSKAAEDVEYPAYGVSGMGRDISPTSADRKLAQNAQLYHYQHQKQQMIAIDSNNPNGHTNNGNLSENDSDDEEGDYTVYECPGLAPTGEMEVRNPMFDEDSTPKAKKNGK